MLPRRLIGGPIARSAMRAPSLMTPSGGVAGVATMSMLALAACGSPDRDSRTDRDTERAGEGSSVVIQAESTVTTTALRLKRVASTSSSGLADVDSIHDAVTDGRGHIVLLDRGRARLLVADSGLTFVTTVPWHANGVTRLWEPSALARLGPGRIAVLDQQVHRITELVVTDDGRGVTWGRTIPLRLASVSWFCALQDGDFLVYGYRDGKRLHVVDGRTGAVRRSFAPADSTLPARAQDLTTQGRISCDESSDEVVLSTWFLPGIEAYEISTGRHLWADRLTPFRPIVFRSEDSVVRIGSGPAGYSRVIAVFHADDRRIIQARLVSKLGAAAADRDTTITYAFARRHERWDPPRLSLPVLIAVDRQHVLSVSATPNANVVLHEIVAPEAARTKGGGK